MSLSPSARARFNLERAVDILPKTPRDRWRLLLRVVVSTGAAVASILFLWFIRSWDPLAATKADDVPIWEIFFSVFGLVYAIIVGLFIIEAHRRMRELSSVVQGELNAIGDVVDFLRYFKEKQQDAGASKVRKRLAAYAEKLIADLEQPNQAPERHTEKRRKEITDIIDAVTELEPQGAASQSALDAIVRKIADLTTFRSQKTEIARRGFPLPFYGLLVFMTLVVIVGFSLMDVNSAALHSVLISVTAVALSWLFMLVWDVDHPLEGYWNIQVEIEGNVAEINERLLGVRHDAEGMLPDQRQERLDAG